MEIPGIKKKVYRWVLYIQNDGRMVVRVPKTTTRVGELHNLNDKYYGVERILPIDSKRVKLLK